MPHKHLPPDDPQEWINRAKSNLERARNIIPGVYLEDLCFDAQQASEKAIKAVFVLRAEKFPFIHDLEALLQRLEKAGVKIPKYMWDADELTDFAILTRYPGWADSVTPREYHRAVRIAAAVLRWAERQVVASKKKPREK